MAGSMWLLASAALSTCVGAHQPGGFLGDGGDGGIVFPLAPAPSPPAPSPPAILGTGDRAVCFMQPWGCLKCWGDGSSGQLGSGQTSNVGDAEGQMGESLTEVDLGGGGRANLAPGTGSPARATLSVGRKSSCAILRNDGLKCWGHYEGLGLGDTITRGDTPETMGDNLIAVNLGKDQTAVEVDVGVAHTCVVLTSGHAKCWGRNEKGMLGQGFAEERVYGTGSEEMGDNLPPINVGQGLTLRTIASGSQHTCVHVEDRPTSDTTGPQHRRVKCWGNGEMGALGQGNNESLGTDLSHMGDNLPIIDLGTRPNRTGAPSHGPFPYEWMLALGSGHGDHNCIVTFDFTMKCWGRNDKGQLGYGDTIDRGNQPEQMGDYLPEVEIPEGDSSQDSSISQVEGGTSHTCVLTQSGKVLCWGGNNVGQLGLDSMVDQSQPTFPVELGQRATRISVRGDESCAILEDGGVKCWGRNDRGQLGQGDKVNYGSAAGQMANLPAIDVGSCDAPPSAPAPTPAPAPEESSSPWLWIILGVVGVVVLIGVIYFFYSQQQKSTEETELQS